MRVKMKAHIKLQMTYDLTRSGAGYFTAVPYGKSEHQRVNQLLYVNILAVY